MSFHVRGRTVRRKMTLLGVFVFPPFENRKGWGTQIRVICGKNKTSRLGHPAGETKTIYDYDPNAAGKTPNSLWPPSECKVGSGSECDEGQRKPKKD
jgi:hypothetical protein